MGSKPKTLFPFPREGKLGTVMPFWARITTIVAAETGTRRDEAERMPAAFRRSVPSSVGGGAIVLPRR